jgi:hypothetical protein
LETDIADEGELGQEIVAQRKLRRRRREENHDARMLPQTRAARL